MTMKYRIKDITKTYPDGKIERTYIPQWKFLGLWWYFLDHEYSGSPEVPNFIFIRKYCDYFECLKFLRSKQKRKKKVKRTVEYHEV